MSDDLLMVCLCGLEYLCDDIAEADAWLRTHEHRPEDGQFAMFEDAQQGQLGYPHSDVKDKEPLC